MSTNPAWKVSIFVDVQNIYNIIDIVDERDDMHVAAAVNIRKRIDFADLLNQPCLAGLATGIGRCLVDVN
jgi:hypothetical protein